MLTSYTNSIVPGNYIDIYISTEQNNKALVGKLLKNVKILAVKTSDGKNVFENSEELRVPTVVIFSLPEDQHLMLRNIEEYLMDSLRIIRNNREDLAGEMLKKKS
jgi:Flp pilus assembly protein CpaB